VKEMQEGQRVEVLIGGEWYKGTALDRPRKLWVKLDDDQPFLGGDIVDENNIQEWKPLLV
jgi:hypothetical protein